MTRADKIRSMTDDELADAVMRWDDIVDYVCEHTDHDECEGDHCRDCVLAYLQGGEHLWPV